MRLLAIGYPLPHPNVDNYSVLTAPSYFDYNALFVDPLSITRVVRELLEESVQFEAFDGRPVINAPTSATAVSAADQVRRRLEETQRLLEAGGVVIVIGRPNATLAGLVGFEGCDRYSWLPAPAGLSWSPPFLRAAEGRTIRVAIDDHPLSPLLREHRSTMAYRAMIDDRQAAVRQAGRVIATGGARVPIAVEFSVLSGRVIFLPVPSEEAGPVRAEIAQRLVDACQALLGESGAAEAPYWARTLALPGLEQIEAELEETEAALSDAKARLDAVRERHDTIAGHRRLLWADGALFAAAVADALRLLGFAVVNEPGEPLIIEGEGLRAFVECESVRDQVVEWPYIRLQRRLEQHLLKEGQPLKGIVVVNGHRESAPEGREPQFGDPLRIACENYRYCLLAGETLFTLVQRALGGADEATLSGMRRRILGGAGHLQTPSALGEVEEERDTGPIF